VISYEVLGRDAAGKIPPAVLQSTVKPDRVFNRPIRPFREFHLRVHCFCLPTPRSLGRPQVGFATLGLVTHQTSCYEVDTTSSQSFSMSCRLQYSLAAAQTELSAVISGVGPIVVATYSQPCRRVSSRTFRLGRNSAPPSGGVGGFPQSLTDEDQQRKLSGTLQYIFSLSRPGIKERPFNVETRPSLSLRRRLGCFPKSIGDRRATQP
jgi:hypothetical protein